MELTTNYLGLKLRSPLVPSASPFSQDIGNIRKMEDSGAGAVVLHSLFEEQLVMDQRELHRHLSEGTESFSEVLKFFPEPPEFKLGPEEYLEHIRKAKAAVGIPVIASLNGSSAGGWTGYARQMEEAGADALELNIYYIPTDPALTAEEVEGTYVDILKRVKSAVTIPVAVKLSPFFSSFSNLAKRLDDFGANGLVLFNRFYQPDINLEALEVKAHVLLSSAAEMRLPLRWIAILYGRLKADLAATTGIHGATDVLKMLMAGAKVTMLCSVLLKRGIPYLKQIEHEMVEWMERNEYTSVREMQGSLSQKSCPDPSAFERAHYMEALRSYKP